MFSSRLPAELARNAVTAALEQQKRAGHTVLDLTQTNPTSVGLAYSAGQLDALADPRAAAYAPDPLGLPEARIAVAASYAAHGSAVTADRLVLTASTSEAYAFLFKLLCDPGDRILVPQPSYPLFDMLAGLEGVEAASYPLHIFDAGSIDRAGLIGQITARSRAILVVSPNNPTGSRLRAADREWLVGVAREHGLALVSDEVFADYPLRSRPDASSLLDEDRVLTFTLGGLSKSAALPQVKLAWIAVSGPDDERRQALDRLELIADTYLSVSTPVQLAAARLLESGRATRSTVLARLSDNLNSLRAVVKSHSALTLLEPEGGWSVVVRVPAVMTEEALVLRLVNEACVLVHPGFFFDFPEEAFVVLSLLPAPAQFSDGVQRLAKFIERSLE